MSSEFPSDLEKSISPLHPLLQRESKESVPTRTEVIDTLSVLCVREKSGEITESERRTTQEFIVLQEYIGHYEGSIDLLDNPTEREFRCVEFAFNLAQIYRDAGYTEEMKETLLASRDAAQAACFYELYWEINDYLWAQIPRDNDFENNQSEQEGVL
jgi:hypothetical protein